MINLIRSTSCNLKNKFCRIIATFSNQNRNMSSKWEEPREMRVPIAYGHIAAKVWGEEGGEKVIALHGWQDNCGTFDKLIPLLQSNLHIVAIDALGHGLSSHKPLGTFYNFFEMILDIHRVVEFLNWDRFSFIAHSLGGCLSLMYASLYPQNIHNIVLLDCLKPGSRDPKRLPEITRRAIDDMLIMEKKTRNPTPVYSREVAKDRLLKGMYNEVTPESADILMKRGCETSACGKGLVFTRDIRVQLTEDLQKLSHESLKEYMSKLKCNLLFILAASSIFKSRSPEVDEDFFRLYEKTAKSVQMIQVEGNHFVHLNNPERVSPLIDSFFKMHATV